MADVLYVRMGGDGEPRQRTPADLAAASDGADRVTAQTPVSLRGEGPFEPLAAALARDGALRDVLAAGIAIPSLRDHGKLRIALGAAVLLPAGLLLELDRELAFGRGPSHAGPGRVVVDLLLVAFVAFELSRKTPRMPRVAATCLLAIALRWGLVAAKVCGEVVHPLVWAATALAVGAAGMLLVRVPSRGRVVLELLGKLGVSRSELFAAESRPEPPGALVAVAIACAAGLPAVLHLARSLGAGLLAQAAVFVTFAAVAPVAARRWCEAEATPGGPSSAVPPARILVAVASGLALTAAAVTAGRLFFDATAEVSRCIARLDAQAKLARAAESAELAHAIAKIRASAPLVLMTSIVSPFAEERIYRGLLQDTLSRKYGVSYGVFAASAAFGVAHFGVYQVALYQTVLLGIGFGVAFAEGGLLAAFFVHATWNLLQLG